jgi:hypothetical protein
MNWNSNKDRAVDMDRFCTLKPLRLQIEEIERRGLVRNDTCWYSGGPRWSRAVILNETGSVLCGVKYSILQFERKGDAPFYAMKAYGKSRGVGPLIINPGTT